MLNLKILEKYRLQADTVETPAGCWTNFLGLHTRADWFPNGDKLVGRYVSDLPIPNDGAYGGASEYASLLTAVDQRGEDRSTFSAVELGAGWGPWISAVGVTCKRLGFGRVNLVGVEAEGTKPENMAEHMRVNGLLNDQVKTKLIRGAAWSSDTVLYFPKAMPMADYGGAASTEKSNEDYRGFAYETEEIPAYSLETICSGLDVVDYAHWDVQGAEWPIAASSRDFLDKKVRNFFVGTHSRKIEGDLLGLFHAMGWDIALHEPCSYRYDRTKKSLEAMGLSDGGMFFQNPKLA